MDWNHFNQCQYRDRELGISLDYAWMAGGAACLRDLEDRLQQAYGAMSALESGAIANPDEQRMVGHYWLRDSKLAPDPAITAEIDHALAAVEEFARGVHGGRISGVGGRFTDLLVVGIGGSALGPQFVAQALGQPGEDRLQLHFLDNTDPDGVDLALSPLRGRFDRTLVLVISKSGGTPETRNGMLEASQAFLTEGVPFAAHAVAVTGKGSQLDRTAVADGWLARFPMWDWVGGRTSELAVVGLLPAALQGFDIRALLAGAAAMDASTRRTGTPNNPAAILAAMWYCATNGRGEKDMVILPYKDRLALLAKYLQQLIMESLGKERDLDGNVVHQGIAVYGNKGSTDQHAYVQQLREGVPNFFATFIEVLKDREGASIDVDPGVTTGDYLSAFLLGTRAALADNGRSSLTITIDELDARAVGAIIALYERAVGLYALLINVNAYHQPGVEAGKKAAAGFLKLQQAIQQLFAAEKISGWSALQVATRIGEAASADSVYCILRHLASNPAKGIVGQWGSSPAADTFSSR
jgi:glucose-6-phosphate isomerase